ncbi:MAG: tRNA-specific 2-thiouridylase [Alistipes sp.]|nr:tRNA-specific 2-thiouridylase [Alistipes sp.]
MKESVLLAFSGGMDSRTAARLLLEEYEVESLTLDTTGDADLLLSAKRYATELGIEHSSLDVQAEFRHRIIDYFTDSYAAGRTPAPCTVCNPMIKWRYLIDEADRRGIEHVATGHYFNIERYNNHLYVARADDSRKDQSYYLWGLSQHVLQRALTPMGHVIKDNIRSGFMHAKESMGLCFLRGESYRDYIGRTQPALTLKGDVVDTEGRKVGSHAGVAFYTIGQKRGFECELSGVAVVGIDAAMNRIIVGKDAELYHSTLEINDCNIVDKEEFMQANDVRVVIRGIGRNPEEYMHRAEPAGEGYRIHLSDPAWAPAAGQPVVFYRQNRVIGGGIVERYY